MENVNLLSDDGESDSDKYSDQTAITLKPSHSRTHNNECFSCINRSLQPVVFQNPWVFYHWMVFSFLYESRKGCCQLLPLASFVAALGGILFGYDIGIISGALLQLKGHFNLTCFHQEMIVTSLIIGGLIASIIGGQIVDHFGRRRAIIANAFFFILGALVLAFSGSYRTLIVGRLVLGFAVSLSAIGECIYISEIAPPARRGLLVSLNELGITVGILLAYLVNFLLINVDNGWRIMFGLSSIPAFLQGLGMVFLPSSPRWLVSMQKHREAKDVISRLWPHCDVAHQMQRLKNSLKDEKEYKLTDLFTTKENLRLRMVIGCGIVFFQQITGQPTVLYYAPAVFQSLGFNSSSSATLATVGLGVVKVIFTTLALAIVDKLGRRTLLLFGVITMTFSVITLSAVTKQVDYMPSQNPCDRNFIGAGHTYISEPAYRLVNHCHKRVISNETHNSYRGNRTSTLYPSKSLHYAPTSTMNLSLSNYSIVVPTTRQSTLTKARRSSKDNETYAINCTKNHRHITIHQIHRYPPTVKYVCLLALMVFVAGYAVGYGPMSWLILTEIFPVGIKGRAVATATVFNWGTNIFISLTFLEIIGSIGPCYTFLIYSILGVFSVIFIYQCIPETKAKTLESISDDLNKRSMVCRPSALCFGTSRSVPVQFHEGETRTTTTL